MGLWRRNKMFVRRVWRPSNQIERIERIRLLESFYHQQNAFKDSVEFKETPYYQQNAFKDSVEFKETPYYQQNAFKDSVEFTESITFENS